MRIDRLEIQNFKKFESLALDLHPQFTLLVGENGSGKTTILDALAVCLSIWLEKAPDTKLINSRRPILPNEIRAEPIKEGDRIQFQERFPVEVTAKGQIGESTSVEWTRKIKDARSKTSNSEAKEALSLINDLYARVDSGENRPLFPVLAYYGAGRAWLPSNEPRTNKKPVEHKEEAHRWEAF
jgi:predicted ATP-binding protein involved in virulence